MVTEAVTQRASQRERSQYASAPEHEIHATCRPRVADKRSCLMPLIGARRTATQCMHGTAPRFMARQTRRHSRAAFERKRTTVKKTKHVGECRRSAVVCPKVYKLMARKYRSMLTLRCSTPRVRRHKKTNTECRCQLE